MRDLKLFTKGELVYAFIHHSMLKKEFLPNHGNVPEVVIHSDSVKNGGKTPNQTPTIHSRLFINF